MRLPDSETTTILPPALEDIAAGEDVALGSVTFKASSTNYGHATVSQHRGGFNQVEMSLHPGDGSIIAIKGTEYVKGHGAEVKVSWWDGKVSHELTADELKLAIEAFEDAHREPASLPDGIVAINLAEAGPEAVHDAIAGALGED